MGSTGNSPYRKGEVALERAFSKLGLGSRTQARDWILEGRVRVNGKVVRNPRAAVRPETARIELDEAQVARAERLTVVFNKPKGLVTTLRDEKGRPTIYSALQGAGQELPAGMMPVGRLDQHTSGLLILTNDSRIGDWILDPAHQIPREYIAEVRGNATLERVRQIEVGVESRGETLRAKRAWVLKSSGRQSLVGIELTEGRNREVRRLCEAVGLEVIRLKRIRLGGLELGYLPPGKWRKLESDELKRAFPGIPLRRPQA